MFLATRPRSRPRTS